MTHRWAAAGLVCIHVGLLTHGLYVHFPTRNEVAHVPAGLSVWENGTFTLYRVNPPLPRTLASLPVLLAGPRTTSIRPTGAADRREEWDAARAFADENPFRYLTLMRLGRVAGVCWSVLGAWLVWRWSRELYGPQAALLGLGVWCLGPTVNAHAQMATPDLPAAVTALLAARTFRAYLRHPSLDRAVWAGLALGVAQLCKFTLLVLYPTWAVVGLIWGWHAATARTSLRAAGHGAVIGLVSLVVINFGYLGDGTFTPLGEYQFVSATGRGPGKPGGIGNRFQGTWAGEVPVPLPYDYLSGMDTQRVDFEGGRLSYLGGQWRDHGWWYYYLYALAVKTPVGVMGLAVIAFLATIRRPTPEDAVLWLPAVAIVAVVSSQTGMTQHSRYVLPAFPFVVIAVSRIGTWFQRPGRWRWRWVVVAGFGLWALVSTARVYPHTLSYFNELVGGPANGWKHLAESNVDWGQDLLFLKQQVETHPEWKPMYIGYENFVDYRHAGFELAPAPTDLPSDRDPATLQAREIFRYGPIPGYFAIDVHNLIESDRTFYTRFQPFDRAGYSIFVYRIGVEEAATARSEMGLPPLPKPLD